MSGGREATSEQSSSVREGAATMRSIRQGREEVYEEDEKGDVKGEEGNSEEAGEDDDEGDESDEGSKKYNESFYPTMTRKVNKSRQHSLRQENFLKRVWAIPLKERKWKDLVTLDTLHAFCGGLEPTLTARQLHASSYHCKFLYPSTYVFTPLIRITHLITFSKIDIGRQRALVRTAVATHKQQEQGSGSAPNMGPKTTLKRKPNAKDDCPSKKGTSSLIGEQQQKAPSPSPFRHGTRKGLMTGKGPVAPDHV
ncbi:hypothetical protein SO802_031846 [Lithocarpus litseifolius]|uniref:Uncharacterized protein n=1 Tax=Lithocarpus litseifolius TaxID=425828 RepID=A0AAW2BS76_9ROSI